jgi:membrane protein DedA with SNARE-associated domain
MAPGAAALLAILARAAGEGTGPSLAARLAAYIGLGLTGIVAEEATPILGGLAAHDGKLAFLPVILAIGTGTWLAALVLYFVGRSHGRWVRKRFPRFRAFFLRAFKVVRRHPWRATLAVRWVFGLRIGLPIACGAARVPLATYAAGSAVSCYSWSLTFVAAGWFFGTAAQRAMGVAERYERWIAGALVVLVIAGWWIARARRRTLERRAVEVIAGHDEVPECEPEERKGI